MKRFCLPLVLVFISLTAPIVGTPLYELDWSHLHTQGTEREASPPAPAPTPRRNNSPFYSIPDFTPAGGYQNRWLRPRVQETRELRISAQAYFNHYTQSYFPIDAVEIAAVRNGRLETQVLYNTGQYQTFPVVVSALAPGDQFRVKLFWDDGSYRVLEDTVNVYTDFHHIVDEPDFMLNPVW